MKLLVKNNKILKKDKSNLMFPPKDKSLMNLLEIVGANCVFGEKINEFENFVSYDDFENVVSTKELFRDCENLQTIPLLDTSNVTDMSSMFSWCSNLQTIPQLDTSNVTDMYQMFYGCENLKTIPLLDTSNVTNMKYMFRFCENLQTIPPLDTSNVTNMESMFSPKRWATAPAVWPPARPKAPGPPRS